MIEGPSLVLRAAVLVCHIERQEILEDVVEHELLIRVFLDHSKSFLIVGESYSPCRISVIARFIHQLLHVPDELLVVSSLSVGVEFIEILPILCLVETTGFISISFIQFFGGVKHQV